MVWWGFDRPGTGELMEREGSAFVFVDSSRMDTIEASRGNWVLQFLVPSFELMERRGFSGTECVNRGCRSVGVRNRWLCGCAVRWLSSGAWLCGCGEMNGQGQKEELSSWTLFFSGQGPKLIQMDIHAPADRADSSHSPVNSLLVPEGEAKLVPPGVVCLLTSTASGPLTGSLLRSLRGQAVPGPKRLQEIGYRLSAWGVAIGDGFSGESVRRD